MMKTRWKDALLGILVMGRFVSSSLVDFTWTDVTEHELARRLHPDASGQNASAYVQRLPSETSRIFELAHGVDLVPADFKSGHHGLTHGTLLKMPVCTFKGKLHTFELRNSGMIPSALEKKISNVRAYHAFEVDGSMSAEVTVGPDGLRAQIWVGETGSHPCYLDPHTVGRADKYTVYSYADPRIEGYDPVPHPASSLLRQHGPRFLRHDNTSRRLKDASHNVQTPPPGLQSYRTYRICIPVAPDYLTFASSKGSTAMSILTATLARANGIWRRVLSINLQLCSDQDKLFKTKAQGNKVPNGNPTAYYEGCSTFMAETGVAQDSYDLAHYVSASGTGGLGSCCACAENYNCKGGTALPNPIGDPFDVDFFAHELGHQFNHLHTFSGKRGNCGGNYYEGESVELGSGRTIMSYAGLCREDNTQLQSSPYFASVSLGIYSNGQHKGTDYKSRLLRSCGTLTETTNNRPTATTLPRCIVPLRTPFVLKGSGTDPDPNTILSYNWEQVDAATKPTLLKMENTDGPLFVSVAPSATGHTRHFPELTTVLKNHAKLKIDKLEPVDDLERLSSVTRELHFTMTVRDHYNGPGGGSSDTAIGSWHAGFTVVKVSKNGPFTVTVTLDGNGNVPTGAVSVAWRLLDFRSDDIDWPVLKGASYSIEYATCAQVDACADTANWADMWGDTCMTYKASKYCNPDGSVGPGWLDGWPQMDIIRDGMPIKERPSQACCDCGGGTAFKYCNPGTFMPLSDFSGRKSWAIGDQGFAHVKVRVPASLAGQRGFFRVIGAASSDVMTDEVYCKFYAVSDVHTFILGPTGTVNVLKTIPADRSTGVLSTDLKVAFVLEREAWLTADAASKVITVTSGNTVLKTIKGSSKDVRIIHGGSTVQISIGDVSSPGGSGAQVKVQVPANLIESMPEQIIQFTTSDTAPVLVAPRIIGSNPTDGATGIRMSDTISFTVSEDVLPGTGSLRILDWEKDVICSVQASTMSFDGQRLSFVLEEKGCFLYQDMTHFVEVDKDMLISQLGNIPLEANFNLSFKAWADHTPPRITSTSPFNGDQRVGVWADLHVHYDKQIRPSSTQGAKITIKPRKPQKTVYEFSVTDDRQVKFGLLEDLKGELRITPNKDLQGRTTYDVIIPDGVVTDWMGNKASAHTFSFTTESAAAPYCAQLTIIAGTEDIIATMFWKDWPDQDEPSVLSLGLSGSFWLTNREDETDVVTVTTSSKDRVTVQGLVVFVAFRAVEINTSATYTLQWSSNVLQDDHHNAVYSSNHSHNIWCNNTMFTLKKNAAAAKQGDIQCPVNFPVCGLNGDCLISSCASGGCVWAPGQNYISGHNGSGVACTGDHRSCPNVVEISGGELMQPALMGIFIVDNTQTPNRNNAWRPIYRMSGELLYYWDSTEQWFIGEFGRSVGEGAACPTMENQWQLWDGSAWSPTLEVSVKDIVEARHTTSGCACQRSWSLMGYPHCQSYCCNYESEAGGDWCYVVDSSCQGREWGYCQVPVSLGDAFDGTYICSAEHTGMQVHIDEWPRARLQFYPIASSTRTCVGEFHLTGSFHSANQTIDFRAGPWIHNPCGIQKFDLTGVLTKGFSHYSGNIAGGECGTFGTSQVCPDMVNVRGAGESQPESMGIYTKSAASPGAEHAHRPIYRSGTQFLYYWSALQGWLIGSTYSNGNANIQSTDLKAAFCPHQARWWKARLSASWANMPITIRKVCPDRLSISGAEDVQPMQMGIFTKVPSILGSSNHHHLPVYRKGLQFLYYWNTKTVRGWLISSNYSNGHASVLSTGDQSALCPHQATGWKRKPRGTWLSIAVIVQDVSSKATTQMTVGLTFVPNRNLDISAFKEELAKASGVNAEDVVFDSVAFHVKVTYGFSASVSLDVARQAIAEAHGVLIDKVVVKTDNARRLTSESKLRLNVVIQAGSETDAAHLMQTSKNSRAVADQLAGKGVTATLTVDEAPKIAVEAKVTLVSKTETPAEAPSTTVLANVGKILGADVTAKDVATQPPVSPAVSPTTTTTTSTSITTTEIMGTANQAKSMQSFLGLCFCVWIGIAKLA